MTEQTATAAPETNKAAPQKTTYIILASIDSGATWTREGEQQASSKSSALSHFYEKRGMPEPDPLGPEPLFQAIPSSSWKAFRPATPRPSIPFAEVE